MKAIASVRAHDGRWFMVVCGVPVCRDGDPCQWSASVDPVWTYTSMMAASDQINNRGKAPVTDLFESLFGI